MVATFSCYKTSFRFPTSSSLSSNIQIYNSELSNLTTTLNFTFVNFQITDAHLAADHMHLHPRHQHLLSTCIMNFFNTLPPTLLSNRGPHQRSRNAVERRNKTRHIKSNFKRQQFTIRRRADIRWKPKHIKYLLIQHNVKYARLSEVRNHIFTIQFNNATDRDAADAILPDDIFNRKHFFWNILVMNLKYLFSFLVLFSLLFFLYLFPRLFSHS